MAKIQRLVMTSLTFMILFSANCLAWGPTGHRVVGEIAQRYLNHSAERGIKKLVGKEGLGMMSNWPDFVKSDRSFDHASPWHYVTIPDGLTYEQIEKDPKGDIVEAIGRMIATLKDKNADQVKKIQALKFLVHFVGDIHQPLHVGKPGDRGGNDVKVKWFGKAVNLHHLWDEELIDFQKLSYTEYATALDIVEKSTIKSWMKDDINVWIKESMDLRATVYDVGDGNLSYEYNFKNVAHLNRRLLQGGVRLAAILNKIF
jgi:hypothetical protein